MNQPFVLTPTPLLLPPTSPPPPPPPPSAPMPPLDQHLILLMYSEECRHLLAGAETPICLHSNHMKPLDLALLVSIAHATLTIPEDYWYITLDQILFLVACQHWVKERQQILHRQLRDEMRMDWLAFSNVGRMDSSGQ
jgi:hypothetical protein